MTTFLEFSSTCGRKSHSRSHMFYECFCACYDLVQLVAYVLFKKAPTLQLPWNKETKSSVGLDIGIWRTMSAISDRAHPRDPHGHCTSNSFELILEWQGKHEAVWNPFRPIPVRHHNPKYSRCRQWRRSLIRHCCSERRGSSRPPEYPSAWSLQKWN
jgi:hypothetical protein